MSHNSIDIALRPVESLTPSELDEIWAITARYVHTDRVVYEAKLRALPEVGLWRVRHGQSAIWVGRSPGCWGHYCGAADAPSAPDASAALMHTWLEPGVEGQHPPAEGELQMAVISC